VSGDAVGICLATAITKKQSKNNVEIIWNIATTTKNIIRERERA